MNKFTYYAHSEDPGYLLRVRGTQVETFSPATELSVAGWIPSVQQPNQIVAPIFTKVGIRQIPSSARNASYTQTA
jgi:hypothetical protein